MMASLFEKPHLEATRAGLVDARQDVEVWVDTLFATLERGVVTADEAFELLATREKLRRVRPELLTAAKADAVLQDADQKIATDGKDLATRAMALLNPAAWRDEAERLEASYEEDLDPGERAWWAADLIDDLDDAELLLVAARRLGLEDAELAEELDECRDWLAHHADAFLAASVYIQSIGQGLRPDLDEVDYDLAATTLKLADLLDAAEVAERELNFAHLRPLPAAVTRQLYARFQAERQASAAARRMLVGLQLLREYLQRRPLAAAAAAPSAPDAPLRCVWTAPDGTAFARIVLPGHAAHDSDLIPLGFFHAADVSPLATYAGRPIRLAGLELVLDHQGMARLAIADLLNRSEPWHLEVGPSWEVWPLTTVE